eukprot:3547090-Prymnesium_polylepis.1
MSVSSRMREKRQATADCPSPRPFAAPHPVAGGTLPEWQSAPVHTRRLQRHQRAAGMPPGGRQLARDRDGEF